MMRVGLIVGTAGILVLAGCASSGVAQKQSTAAAQELTRPGLVIVYDFAGTRDDLPSDSVIARYSQERSVPQTSKEVELGRQLGRLLAQNLVRELNKAGITAEPVDSAPVPFIGDGVVRGEFIVVNEGSPLTRVFIGFGAGKAELKTLAEAYEVTATGLTPLGSAQIEAKGGKLPGFLVSAGLGAGFGGIVSSAVTSAVSSSVQETGETIEAAAQRTAKEISKLIVDAYKKRGWL
jgi:hypothetical protein